MIDFILDMPMIFVITIVFVIAVCVGAFLQRKDKKTDDVTTSKDLHEQMNRENEREGKTPTPAINATMGTSSNNLARRDHSWSSVPDFFIKLLKERNRRK